MSLTHPEKLTKRSNPFCEPPMAVIGSKPPEAQPACTAKITPCALVSGERTGVEKLTKRRNPFCEPPMAVIGSKLP